MLKNLASHGIIAVSIDAHEFNEIESFTSVISDADYFHERGKLYLWHLKWWSHLNNPSEYDGQLDGTTEQFPDDYTIFYGIPNQTILNDLMDGRVDMSRISLSGHSKGGEAALHAFEQNTDFNIGSISAIAPSANDPPPQLSDSVPFFVIISASDCDIGVPMPLQYYNRMPDDSTKSGIYVYGANHFWFNAVWAAQNTPLDGDDCVNSPNRPYKIPKADQQRLGEAYLAAFARIHLNGEVVYKDTLRGELAFPSTDGLTIFHIYHDAYHWKLENGLGSSAIVGEPSPSILDVVAISVPGPGTEEFLYTDVLQVHWQGGFLGAIPYIEYNDFGTWNVSSFDVLSFRAAWTNWFAWTDPNPIQFPWIVVELTGGGQSVALDAFRFGEIPEPYLHPERPDGDPFNVMTTVRIPLRSFSMTQNSGVDLSQVDKVRFYFYYPMEGELYLDDVEFSL